MADEVDSGNEAAELFLQDVIEAASKPMPVGRAGECSRCEEYSPRLVRGVCAPCRDHFKLP